MFPTPGSSIIYNEDGEVIGWDAPAEPEFCGTCGYYHPLSIDCSGDYDDDDEDE